MKRLKLVSSVALLSLLMVLSRTPQAMGQLVGIGGAGAAGACPYVLSNPRASLEITDVIFLTELLGSNGGMRIPPDRLDEYRIAVVTIRVTKNPGEQLTVAGSDLTLHYRTRSGHEDVAPCEGLSAFTGQRDVDRPIKFWPHDGGSGWMKQSTGPRSTQSRVVYFDAIFNLIEPDVQDIWLCVGKPTTDEPFRTEGWGGDQ